MGIEATFIFLSARKLVPYPINSPFLHFYTHDFAFPSNNSLKRINFTLFVLKKLTNTSGLPSHIE
jgi:hypothetical protein